MKCSIAQFFFKKIMMKLRVRIVNDSGAKVELLLVSLWDLIY